METARPAFSSSLKETHRALVLQSKDRDPTVETLSTPSPTSGSVIIRVLAASVISYIRDVYRGTGSRQSYTFPLPMVTGSSTVGRIVVTGPDTTCLKEGQLVFFDVTLRGRDDPTAIALSGVHDGFTSGSKKLMGGEWRDSTYAQYAKVPLENVYALDEKLLLNSVDQGGLGYDVEDLLYLTKALVPFGGLRDVGLKSGETVIIAPATGSFGSAAVKVALAMGAGRILAMGRNEQKMHKLAQEHDRVTPISITGDISKDTGSLTAHGRPDMYLDISPPQASQSTHIKSCIMSLKHSGRVSFMGGIMNDISIPYPQIMFSNISLKGNFMFAREDIKAMITMIETGILKLGPGNGMKIVGKYGLDEWKRAFDEAAEHDGPGESVVLMP